MGEAGLRASMGPALLSLSQGEGGSERELCMCHGDVVWRAARKVNAAAWDGDLLGISGWQKSTVKAKRRRGNR